MNVLPLFVRRWLNRARVTGAALTAQTKAPSSQPAGFDVSDAIWEIDLAALGAVRDAPVWMTRAERLTLYSLIFSLRPARYLEIGTFKGGSAMIACAAMDAQKTAGRIFCVDPEPQMSPEHWQSISHRAVMLKGFSPEVLPKAREMADGPFDFALIDGAHTFAAVLADAVGVWPLMAVDGYLIFHDAYHPDVARAIEAFLAQASSAADCGHISRELTRENGSADPQKQWAGLRLIRKTS